jgi:hypothetical protein
MIRLVTYDWQLDSNPRDRYRINFVVEQLPKLIDKYKVEQLLFLGDICEQKDSHPAPLVNEIVNAFHDLSQQCEVIILQGNHDFLHNAHPFFEFVNRFKNICWISKPTERDGCLYLPHTRDYKKDWANIGFTKDYAYIFAHNIFSGVSTNTGHALSGIPPSIFPNNAFVISGDVHEPQTFHPVIGGSITYVGSPTLCDFGDFYQPRVLLLDDLKVKSIKVFGQQKRLVQCTWDESKPLKARFEYPHQTSENDIVKINVHLEMKHVSEWAIIREQVEAWAIKNNFVVHAIVPVVAYEAGKRQSIVNSSRKSDAQYLETFVGRLGVDERTAAVGKEIIELI